MNILFIGSSGALSLSPYKKLLTSVHDVKAVGVYKPVVYDNKIIALETESLALAASQQNIPVIDLSQPVDEILRQCRALFIDIILMSCYGRRLPELLSDFPVNGCFNMHPSLLPAFRGPEPVFWQMKTASDTGVSWHKVIHDLDAGDIVAQQKVFLEEGASYSDISQQLAETGAELLLQFLARLTAGTLSVSRQNPALSSYYPYPRVDDFVVDTSWTAQHAYNFMRATRAFGQPYHCQIGQHRYLLAEALDYDNNDTLTEAVVKAGSLYIPCKQGVLVATFTGKL